MEVMIDPRMPLWERMTKHVRAVMEAYAEALDDHIFSEDDLAYGDAREQYDGCRQTLLQANTDLHTVEDHLRRHTIAEDRMQFILDNEEALVDEMLEHGGSFAHAIALAWRRSDSENRQKLRESFGNMLYTYKQFIKARSA